MAVAPSRCRPKIPLDSHPHRHQPQLYASGTRCRALFTSRVHARHGSASGVGQAAISPEVGPVRLPPNPGSGEGRHELTAQRTASPTVRFVSYNLLADQYAATDTARDVLFNYCPPEYVFQSVHVVAIRNVLQSS